MKSPTPDAEVRSRHLMLKYMDGTLEEHELAELNATLKGSAARRRDAAWLLIQQMHLREIGREEKVFAAVSTESIPADSEPERAAGWLQFISAAVQFRPRWAFAAGIAAVLGCVLLILAHPWSSATSRLVSLHGLVTVERNGRQSSASAGLDLRPGDRIQLHPAASAVIRYRHEATWFRLSDSAQLHIEDSPKGKALSLQVGSLWAFVAPQPAGRPMHLITPQAQARVVGTEFTLAADTNTTRLDVWEGAVRLTRTKDGTSTDVRKGEFALTGNVLPLTDGKNLEGVLREYWAGFKDANATLADPQHFVRSPSGSQYVFDFESPSNSGDGYLARLRTSLRPPASGQYEFWICGDDRAELWLSSDDSPLHKVKICWTSEWTAAHDWDKSVSQRSVSISLEAGRKYYLEALHQESAGADCLAVAWLRPGGQREVIPGSYLTPPPRPRDNADAPNANLVRP